MPNTPYGIQALTGELNKLARAGEGDRNNTLNEVWLKLSKRVLAGHLDKIETAQRVYEVASQVGLPDAEIRATMASAEKRATDDGPGSIPEPRPPIDFGGLKTTGGGVQAYPPWPGAEVSTSAELEIDHYRVRKELGNMPKPKPLLEGVIDEHTLFAITGRDRSYKSFLVLDWLACLATGKSWLTHATQQVPVLLVVGEGAYGLHARATAWETEWQQTIPDSFHVRIAPVNLFKFGADVVDLYERIERENYGVVIFDTLQRMTSGADSNHAKDAGLIIGTMDYLRRANQQVAIGIVAHTGKTDEDTRGSSAFEDDLDAIWRIKRDEESQVIDIKLDKRKDGPEGLCYQLQPKSVEDTSSIVLELATGPLVTRRPPEHHLPLLKILAGAGESGESKTTLLDLLGISVRALYAAAKYLETERLAVRFQSGQRRFWKITPSGLSALERIGESEADQQ